MLEFNSNIKNTLAINSKLIILNYMHTIFITQINKNIEVNLGTHQ